jgi:hypothetical protein
MDIINQQKDAIAGSKDRRNATHEIVITGASLSDRPPVILSACSPRSPVRILTISETGITGKKETSGEA